MYHSLNESASLYNVPQGLPNNTVRPESKFCDDFSVDSRYSRDNLWAAILHGDDAQLRGLLKRGLQPDLTLPFYSQGKPFASLGFQEGETESASLLQVACEWERIPVVKVLLEHGADVNIMGVFNGRKLPTPLQCACRWKPLPEDPSPSYIKTRKPLSKEYTYISFGNYALSQVLLQNKADPNLTTSPFSSPLHLAVMNDNIQITLELLKYGAHPSNLPYLLRHLSCNCSLSLLGSFIDANMDFTDVASVITPSILPSTEGCGQAHYLCDTLRKCSLLVRNQSTSTVDGGNKVRLTDVERSLAFGAQGGGDSEAGLPGEDEEALIERIMREGVGHSIDINCTERSAVYTFLTTLVTWGVDINAQNNNGQTCLHIAWAQFNVSLTHYLVTELNADYTIKDASGCDAFHSHSSNINALLLSMAGERAFRDSEVKKEDFIRFLLDCDIDLTEVNDEGETAVHLYFRYNYSNLGLLSSLLSKCSPAVLDIRSRAGQTALELCCLEAHNRPGLELLLRAGARGDGLLEALSQCKPFPGLGWLAVALLEGGVPLGAVDVAALEGPEWRVFREALKDGAADGAKSSGSLPPLADTKRARELEVIHFNSYIGHEIELPSLRVVSEVTALRLQPPGQETLSTSFTKGRPLKSSSIAPEVVSASAPCINWQDWLQSCHCLLMAEHRERIWERLRLLCTAWDSSSGSNIVLHHSSRGGMHEAAIKEKLNIQEQIVVSHDETRKRVLRANEEARVAGELKKHLAWQLNTERHAADRRTRYSAPPTEKAHPPQVGVLSPSQDHAAFRTVLTEKSLAELVNTPTVSASLLIRVALQQRDILKKGMLDKGELSLLLQDLYTEVYKWQDNLEGQMKAKLARLQEVDPFHPSAAHAHKHRALQSSQAKAPPARALTALTLSPSIGSSPSSASLPPPSVSAIYSNANAGAEPGAAAAALRRAPKLDKEEGLSGCTLKQAELQIDQVLARVFKGYSMCRFVLEDCEKILASTDVFQVLHRRNLSNPKEHELQRFRRGSYDNDFSVLEAEGVKQPDFEPLVID